MATAPRLPEHDAYIRRLIYVQGQSCVESRCSRCGAVIVGSATESLVGDEKAHLRQCPKRPGRILVARLRG